MKKILFAVMALSTIAFALNNNPGTDKSASVPVLVKAEIIEPSDSLQITDLAGTLLTQIELNHGRLVKGGATAASVVSQDFKVMKGDKLESDGFANLSATGKSEMAVAIDKTTTELLNKTTIDPANKLTATLNLLGGKNDSTHGISGYDHGYKETIAAGKKSVNGRITSTLSKETLNGPNSVVGIHDNGSERVLKVVYTPIA